MSRGYSTGQARESELYRYRESQHMPPQTPRRSNAQYSQDRVTASPLYFAEISYSKAATATRIDGAPIQRPFSSPFSHAHAHALVPSSPSPNSRSSRAVDLTYQPHSPRDPRVFHHTRSPRPVIRFDPHPLKVPQYQWVPDARETSSPPPQTGSTYPPVRNQAANQQTLHRFTPNAFAPRTTALLKTRSSPVPIWSDPTFINAKQTKLTEHHFQVQSRTPNVQNLPQPQVAHDSAGTAGIKRNYQTFDSPRHTSVISASPSRPTTPSQTRSNSRSMDSNRQNTSSNAVYSTGSPARRPTHTVSRLRPKRDAELG